MTAGVQTNDSAAYLPPPPSSSVPDVKGSNSAGKPAKDSQAAGAQGSPSDFQSELQNQQSGEKETASTRAGATTTGSGKTGKKRDAKTDDANPAAVTPVQVADPQKPILPFALALAQLQELAQQPGNATTDPNTKSDETATADEIAQGAAQQPVQVSAPSLAAVAPLPALQLPGAVKQFMKARPTPQPEATPKQTTASNAASGAVTDPVKTLVLPFAPVPTLAQDIPVRPEGKKSEAPASQDPAVTLAKPGASSESLPASPADLQLPAVPAELIASGVQGTADSAPASPSALAFAARISAAQQKAEQTVAVSASQNPVPSPAVSGSQTAVEIPMRYAATAQIIQSATLKNGPGTNQDEPKKDTGDFTDRTARADSRTDMVLPQFESVSQAAANPGSASPQPAAPTSRTESVIEPPAAPPTSPHDIRVRVPDNNGGSTHLRFLESGGEVRVSVRTADEGLAQNLRTHLNDLTQRLSDGGMPAEIWKPASSGASSQNDSHQPNQHDGRGSGGQGSGGHSGQQDRQQKRPAWLDEMEASLQSEQN